MASLVKECLTRLDAGSTPALVVDDLAQAGAQAVILGCTEIGLLIKPGDTPVKLYDTTAIHAARAVDLALEGS